MRGKRRADLRAVITTVMHELRERHPRVHLETGLFRPSRGCVSDQPIAIEVTGGKETLDRVRAGDEDPACPDCGGILKSATISFGQSLDQATLRRAVSTVAESDLLLAIGTSLQVYPVSGLVDLALGAGAKVVIVNAEPTPYDDDADAVLREPIGVVLPALAAMTNQST